MYFRLRFAKFGVMKFIGHLDVMRYFQKAIRRSGLLIKYSQGYNPHQLLVFAQPLGVGVTSDGEYMDMEIEDDAPEIIRACSENGFDTEKIGKGYLDEKTASAASAYVAKTLSGALTDGFEIVSCRYIPWKENEKNPENSMSLVAGAEYLLSLKEGYRLEKTSADLAESWNAFINQSSIKVIKKSKSGEKEMDIRPYIFQNAFFITDASLNYLDGRQLVQDYVLKLQEECPEMQGNKYEVSGLEHCDFYADGISIYLRLSAGSSINIKPELVLTAFCEYAGIEYNGYAFQTHRMNLLGAGLS